MFINREDCVAVVQFYMQFLHTITIQQNNLR